MPVKYFVSQDSQGREQPPDYSYETKAVIEIIKRVYETFNHHPNLYAIITNLNKRAAMADLAVITERGLGVVELKHYFGPISMKGTEWYAGPKLIYGNPNVGYRNPHEQVQIYTETIRNKLINPSKLSFPWLSGGYTDWEEFQFATAVCFTHKRASFDGFREWYDQKLRKGYNLKMWEEFRILKPAEIPNWIAELRFRKYRLSAKQIIRIVTDLFRATEWTEIDKLMPTGKPYAYLFLKQGGEIIAAFGLTSDNITIGRNAEVCDISIPEQFRRVSRVHAKIKRSIDGTFIQDENSAQGTFINGKRIDKPVCLQAGQHITLGGRRAKEEVCLLEFSYEPPEPSSTQIGSQMSDI